MSKAYDNAKELEYIQYDSTNNRINFSVSISSNNAPVASQQVYDANTSNVAFFSLPAGNTAQRPASPANGAIRYNTTIGVGEMYFEQSGWASFVGEPLITDVTPGTFNGTSGTAFEITGVRFDQDAQIYFVAANGTSYLAGSTAFYSPTRIIATTPRPFTVAYEPLSVKIVQNSGTYTKQNVIDCGGVPSWVTTAGTLGSIFGGNTVNVYVSATEPEGNSITYTIASGTLPTGLTLTSANGLIQGFNTGATTNTTYNFTITASDSVNNTDRAFSYIIFNRPPVFNTASNLLITDNEIDTYVANTTINAYDPDGGVITYNLDSGSVPSGMTFVSANGALVGAPTRVDSNTTSTFTVTITDVGNLSNTRTFNLTITTDTDPHFANTVLLLKTTSSNTVIKDASSNNLPITVTGDARASNFNPFGNSWSNYFDGTDDYLSVSSKSSIDWMISSGNSGTIEAWIYVTSYRAAGSAYHHPSILGLGETYLNFGVRDGGTLRFYWYQGAETFLDSSTTIPLNTWTHVAAVVNGAGSNNLKLYINGVNSGTGTFSNITWGAGSGGNDLRVGSEVGNATSKWLGYISNLRVSNNAVYTTNFSPSTTPLTTTASTTLLTCHKNRFVDGTGTYTFTRNGDTKVTAFSPFEETDTANGSMYFDGSGDYILTSSTTSMNLGTNDFCLEFWFYANSVSGTYNGLCGSATDYKGPSISRYGSKLMYGLSSTGSSWNVLGAEGSVGSIDIIVGQWYHFALCRSGTTISGYLNGRRDITTTSSASLISRTEGFSFGSWFPGSYVWNGFISNARFVNGSTPYDPTQTSITVPTLPLTAITNTVLLTLQNRQPHNNHGFQDSSRGKNLITRSGNASQGTFTPFSANPEKWSNYFDGTQGQSKILRYTGNAVFAFPGTFTLEFWYQTTNTSSKSFYGTTNESAWTPDGFGFSHNNGSFTMHINQEGAVKTWPADASTYNGAWHHVAFVRDSSNNVRCFYDGTEIGTPYNYASQLGNASYKVVIGAGEPGGNGSAFSNFVGHLSNFRITKGAALYSTNFTPSTTPLTTSVSGGTVSLLTCQSNRFLDNSVNNFSILAGNPFVQPFSPFAPNTIYSTANTGGSVYLDGSGDYLTIGSGTDINLGTSDFSMEYWYYLTAFGSYAPGVFCKRTGGVATGWAMLTSGFVCLVGGTWHDSWSTPYWVGSVSTTGFNNSTSTTKIGQWTHVLLTRQGTDARWFVNGQLIGYQSRSGAIDQLTGVPLAVGFGGATSEQPFTGYISGGRISLGSVPVDYQTSSTTTGTQIFVPPTSPPTLTSQNTRSNSVTTLLNFTDAAIVDYTGKNIIETVGDAKANNSTYKFTPGSMYFDGTEDYLVSPANKFYDFGTGDFTIECWVRLITINSAKMLVTSNYNAGTGAGGWALIHRADISSLSLSVNNNVTYTKSWSPTAGIWYHVSVSRSGTNLRFFIDGTQIGTTSTSSDNITGSSTVIVAGNSTSNLPIDANINDLRITKSARYVANFTAPTKTFAKA